MPGCGGSGWGWPGDPAVAAGTGGSEESDAVLAGPGVDIEEIGERPGRAQRGGVESLRTGDQRPNPGVVQQVRENAAARVEPPGQVRTEVAQVGRALLDRIPPFGAVQDRRGQQ